MKQVTSVRQVEDIFNRISTSIEFESFLNTEARGILNNLKKRHGIYPKDIKWTPLKAETVNRKMRGNSPLLETGELRNSYNVKSEKGERSIGSDIDKAIWMEKGTVNIPSRPVVLPEARKQDIEFTNNFNQFITKHIKQFI